MIPGRFASGGAGDRARTRWRPRAVFSGYGVGLLVERYGWAVAIHVLAGVSALPLLSAALYCVVVEGAWR